LAHYWTFLQTIAWTFNCVFPSLANNSHIVHPTSKIVFAFYHLSTVSLNCA
jgi:hypothetical protein